MKKFIVIFLGVLLITSCSNGLEKQAKEQLKKTMKEMLKNPDSATLTNVKTELNNDSLCIIHFTCKAQNGFGGYSTGRFEYIYAKVKNLKEGTTHFEESVYNLDEDNAKSVIESAADLTKSLFEAAKKDKKMKSADEMKKDSINNIYFMSVVSLISNGRKVEKDTGEDIKL